MVDIEDVTEKKEITLEDLMQQIMERLARLEATCGYIIHSLDIKPPVIVNAETGEDSQE